MHKVQKPCFYMRIESEETRSSCAYWQPACIYKLDDNYLPICPSHSELDHSCLETGCLPPGKLCNATPPLSNQPFTATTCKKKKFQCNAKTRSSHYYSSVIEPLDSTGSSLTSQINCQQMIKHNRPDCVFLFQL